MPKTYSHRKTSFREDWLSDPELKHWLLKAPNDTHAARCRYCPAAVISLSSMGRQALTSHMKGKKHINASKIKNSLPIGTYFKEEDSGVKQNQQVVDQSFNPPSHHADVRPSTSSGELSSSSSIQPLGMHGIKQYLLSESITKAEIIWCVQSVMSHTSFRSAALGIEAMKMMFPDSQIAEKIEIHRTKLSYIINFGLAPYFNNQLIKEVEKCPCFVISFDESLNKISIKQQMDIVVRFWDSCKNEVVTRYLTSQFLHSASAVELQGALMSALKPFQLQNLLQVSMDGPNVNIKLLKDLKVYLGEQITDRTLIDFGTCSLHTVHNAFKVAMLATKWDLVKFLRALYNYFKESPARRGEYIRNTKSSLFPKKFCAVRWLDNSEVAQTAIDIIPNIKKYISAISESKGRNSLKTSASYTTIVDSLKDPLLSSKLAFFKTLSADTEPFLKTFQTNWPFVPFLYSALSDMTKDVQKRFVKPEKVRVGVDLDDEENLLSFKHVDLGFLTRAEIAKSVVKDVDIALLRRQAKAGMKAFVKKIEERSPLKFSITKHLTSVDPKLACTPEGESLFNNLVEDFVSKSWISGTKADVVSREYSKITKEEDFVKASASFKNCKERLDIFWMVVIGDNEKFNNLKDFLKIVLTLSHGNAQVERGFSINKECLVDNLKEKSLIGLRTVYDAVIADGGLKELTVTKSMINSVRNSYAKYKEALQAAREQSDSRNQKEDVKKRKLKELDELKSKKARLMDEALKEGQALDAKIKELSKQL